MRELTSFKEAYARLKEADAEVVAVSADSIASHERFIASLGGLPYPLLSDTSLQVIAAYDTLNDKATGPRRSVFVVGKDGLISYSNTRYEVGKPEHFEAVLRAVGAANG